MASTISSASVEASSPSGSAAAALLPLAGAVALPFFQGNDRISEHVSMVLGLAFRPSAPGSGSASPDHDFGAGFRSRCHFIPLSDEMSSLAFASTDSSHSIMEANR